MNRSANISEIYSPQVVTYLANLREQGYQVIPAEKATSNKTFEFRGAALVLQSCTDHEIIISGPSETGKTIAALYKLNRLAHENKGLQGAIIRKTRADMDSTVLETWKKVAHGYTTFGGEKPEWFDYPNGSRIWVAGIDHPGKALSAERDVIVVNQCEELELSDWETLVTRVTHRAGHVQHPQLIGDCNPGAETHWIKSRTSVRLLESKHEDNPFLFDANGQLTETGRADMAILDSLTGLRYKRLRQGLWVSAEGVIYEFTSAHQIEPFAIPKDWKRFRAIDFGYTHPFVCGWFAKDPGGRLYLYRQIYMTGRTVKVHSADIKRYSYDEKISDTVCDHDAEDMATLRENGISTSRADKAVKTGIEKVEDRLMIQQDALPRLMVFKDGVINGVVYGLVEIDRTLQTNRRPIRTEQEFPTYIWSNHKTKDEPVKQDDHGMDMLRYAVMHEDGANKTIVMVGGKRVG